MRSGQESILKNDADNALNSIAPVSPETALGSAQAALLALALRRRFMR
jgi:hypothetical protein